MRRVTPSDQQWISLTSRGGGGQRTGEYQPLAGDKHKIHPQGGFPAPGDDDKNVDDSGHGIPVSSHLSIGFRRSLTGRPLWTGGGATRKVTIMFGLRLVSTPKLLM